MEVLADGALVGEMGDVPVDDVPFSDEVPAAGGEPLDCADPEALSSNSSETA